MNHQKRGTERRRDLKTGGDSCLGKFEGTVRATGGEVSTMWRRVRDFAQETGVRLHGGTGEDPTPTGVSLRDREISGDFRMVLLRELQTERAWSWLKKWMSLAEQGGLAQCFSQVPESNYWIRDC